MYLLLVIQSMWLSVVNIESEDKIGELAAQVVTLNELVGKFELH